MCDYAYAFQALIDARCDLYQKVYKRKEKLNPADYLEKRNSSEPEGEVSLEQ